MLILLKPSKQLSQITEVLNWPTSLLILVVISPAILGLFQVGYKASYTWTESSRNIDVSLDHAAFLLALASLATFWKWLYDTAFRLNLKYFPERNQHRLWQVGILFPLMPLATGATLNIFLPEPELYDYLWVWSLFFISWLLMCLLTFIRTTWLLGKLEGKNRYFPWFLLLLVYPIGIWWIQPVLREAWSRDIEKKDVDHFLE